jgi:lipoate-protein ligase A
MDDLALLRGAMADGAAADLALTAVLAEHVSRGEHGSTVRIYRPGPTVAFGRLDTLAPGFAEAVAAARSLGFEPVLRGPGGRAAAYHHESLVVELVLADPEPRAGIWRRYAEMAALLEAALLDVGVVARTGELPGEYCPGEFSLIAADTKLGGIAQRVVARASVTGAALVVRDAAPVRDVLVAVYAALGQPLDPATVGAVERASPAVSVDELEAAVERAIGRHYRLTTAAPDPSLVGAANERATRHRIG